MSQQDLLTLCNLILADGMGPAESAYSAVHIKSFGTWGNKCQLPKMQMFPYAHTHADNTLSIHLALTHT